MKEKENMLGQPKQGKSCESEGQEDIMSKSEKSEEAVVRNEKAPKIQSEQNSSVTGLSPIKSLHKARIQPTLPNLLTKYGLEVKDAVQTMSAKKKEKKKKVATFEDEDEKEKEKNRQKEEKHLEIFHDMTRLRDYYYNEYMMLLQNKVQKQRQEIEQRSQDMNEKENRKKNRGPIAKRPERHNLSSNTSYLENIPKTDFYFIVQLQDKLVREGKLRTPTDLDAFWQKIQQPEVFYAHFKSQKCSDWRGEMSVHFNTMHDVLGNVPSTEELGPKTLSRITESRETLPASAGAAQSWAITQQFPAVNKGQNKSLLQGSKATQLPKSSFLTDLEKRFPKLEMPKLHCFTMDLGPKLPNPDEVTHQRHLRYLQNRRLAHMHNINKMHQIAMSYSAATTRILSKQDDLDFLWDGHQLTDLIPDHLLHSNSSGQEVYLPDISQTESLDFSPNCSLPVSYHTVNQHQHISQDNDSIHPNIVQLQDGGTMQTDLVIHGEVSRVNSRVSSRSKLKSGKAQQSKDTVDGDNIAVLPISDKPHTTHSSPIPLSLGEVIDKSRIIEAKCLSTLWTNYMKGEDAVQT
ncbi:uncharacterized protein LOC112566043 isoform X2 [Pomacea canaliculata]|uniref:uncharacterized protein LOC112566043 isoform X2 n=1 Tax=Pomacea canaliculata TaxID=400727 RepID=UPI000D738B49|nr:uncharacterized protein LOC112566043 isoform X2 [Pomacea canaliculata]